MAARPNGMDGDRDDPLPAGFICVSKKHGPRPYVEGEKVPVYNTGMFRNPCDGPMRSGDLVILYFEDESMDYLYLRPENFAKHSGKFGDFDHRDFVGKEFTSKIYSRTPKVGRRGRQSDEKGWCYALCPTPELWTEVLPHRTQIIQTSDQAVICFQLSLWDGKVVLEAGTGSGAMATSMARCVMPRGRVHTFEFNEVRAQKARDEFEMNGLVEPLVIPRHRDVCAEGFGMTKEADAIFLDLPQPWLAIDHAIEAGKHGCRFSSYSPCIEQVQRTVEKLRERHCDHIKTIEVREREFEVVKNTMAEVQSAPTKVKNDEEHASKARKVEDSVPWQLPPYMAVPYPEQRGHTAYLTFCTLPYEWAYDERAPYADGRPLPDLSEYPEGTYPAPDAPGDDAEMADAPIGPPIPPPAGA